ncbi:MAG: LysR substrate-binding domain-containing protein [Casimicrobiaceae bacterium]
MQKTLRQLPSLDFLRGFEAAGRRLSFTLAAEEIFVTQSALSRQIKAIEDAVGVTLFERRHRALELTPAGRAFHHEVTLGLRNLAGAVDALRARNRAPGLTVSTTVSFASLWLIPRLATFRSRHPEVEVYVGADDRVADLARGDVDVAVRYLADGRAPADAVHLFGERLMPVASPLVLRRGPPLARPADLSQHVLLHLDDPTGLMPWLNWPAWLTANGQADLHPAGAMRFSLYDQVIQAAIAGQGVALGRVPLIERFLDDRRLVAPFARRYDSPRSYFAIAAPHAAQRPEAKAFVAWLREETQAPPVPPAAPSAPRKSRPRGPRHAT